MKNTLDIYENFTNIKLVEQLRDNTNCFSKIGRVLQMKQKLRIKEYKN